MKEHPVRVTPNSLHRVALNDVLAARARLARTQEQASSGLRINRPSDDPVGAGQVTSLETDGAALAQFQRVVSGVRGRVGAVENALGETNTLLIRLRELAIEGANGTQDAATRALIANEVASIHDALVAQANTQFGGAHVFGGFASAAPPFAVSGVFDPATATAPTVAFGGDANQVQVEIDAGVQVAVSMNGQRAFQGDANGDNVTDAGREDVFAVAQEVWRALVTNDPAAITATLDRIDRASSQISAERSQIGAVDSALDRAAQGLAKRVVDVEKRTSDLRDADLARVVSDMMQQESALQAGLSAMGRLVQPTLLDFLR
jgi:flagellar hook-associated protein 3 FlgL